MHSSKSWDVSGCKSFNARGEITYIIHSSKRRDIYGCKSCNASRVKDFLSCGEGETECGDAQSNLQPNFCQNVVFWISSDFHSIFVKSLLLDRFWIPNDSKD